MTQPSEFGDGEASGRTGYLDRSLWRQLAASTTTEEFAAAWLGLQARMIGGVGGGLVVLDPPESGDLEPTAVWPAEFIGSSRLLEMAQRTLSQRKGIVRQEEPDAAGPDSEPVFIIGYPITLGKRAHGAAAMEISSRPQIQLQAAMRQLQWGSAWLQKWILQTTADPGEAIRQRAKMALEVAGLALEEEKFRAAATGAVTELASRLHCDRVSVGFVSRKQVKVRALSHSAEFTKQMNLIRSIGVAMGECVDQRAILRHPETADDARHVTRAHEHLARTHGDGAVCTVPFLDRDGEAFGAMTFERATAEPFDDDTVELCDSVAALVGPILEEKRQNDRLLITKAVESVWFQIKHLVGPKHAVRKLVALIVLALVLFFVFAHGRFRITAETILEGKVQRVIAAPFRGFIFEAPLRGGDIVNQGDLICSLDVRDLRLEYSKWSNERERFVLEQRKAMAEGDRAAKNVMSKKVGQAEAQIALLSEQLERARIVAPFDGVIVSGDLSQSLGAPVETGDVLFEIAPLESYRVILQVDERDIGEVIEGQTGELLLTSMPQSELTFTVTKITPVSQSEEGRNFFEVEGRLDQVTKRLRPGMQGYAKIDVDRRRLISIWTRDMIHWLRIKLWTWTP